MRVILGCIVAILFSLSAAARADNRPWSLVCFTQDSLESVLSTIVNAQQYLRNDPWQTISKRQFRKYGCDFVQIPAGSDAIPVGFFTSEKGFIFPLFRIRYATTRLKVFSADGIFNSRDWTLVERRSGIKQFGEGRRGAAAIQKIAPNTCEVLEGFLQLSGGRAPDYMVAPRNCPRYTIR